MTPSSLLSASRAGSEGAGAGGGTCTAGAVAVVTCGGLAPDKRYHNRPSTPSPASTGMSHRPMCAVSSGITCIARGATCSTRWVVVVVVAGGVVIWGCPRKPDTQEGMPEGTAPP